VGIHKQLCLIKNPNVAAWAAFLFGAYGLIGLTTLHHKIDVGLFAKIAYLAIAVIFLALLKPMTCAVERVPCILLFAVFAIDFSVTFLWLSSNQFLTARAINTSIWLLMALICAISAMRTKRST
jgi:hypothetical protein